MVQLLVVERMMGDKPQYLIGPQPVDPSEHPVRVWLLDEVADADVLRQMAAADQEGARAAVREALEQRGVPVSEEDAPAQLGGLLFRFVAEQIGRE